MTYFVLDSVSCIRTIGPSTNAPEPVAKTELQRVGNVIEDGWEEASSKVLWLEDVLSDNKQEKHVITQQDLEEILHNKKALRAPKDVFSAVLRLSAGMAMIAA
ncbi:hypothetical protein G6011_07148 [Alternaria panax]|uniref:Uncharacterized protein n=1 Tax=Alternaria panax TaxID=48097 RepID=A0AAD4I588_9PLEO|nr:hypothetical protein G6011_07148 [Alternaria panax]